MTPSAELPRVERWERRTQRPLIALAVLFAIAYAAPVAADDHHLLRRIGLGVEWGVWACFAADFAIRLKLAERRLHFIRTHLIDLFAVLLPLIQPLRLLRLVSTMIIAARRTRASAQVRLTTYIGGAVLGLLIFGSLAVLDVERGQPGASIHNLGDSLWWSFSTMTTVGYGDLAPVTGLGRMLAVCLMISGIALLGLVTANIAAWFISRFDQENAYELEQTQAMKELTAQIAALRAEVAELRAAARPLDGADAPSLPQQPGTGG